MKEEKRMKGALKISMFAVSMVVPAMANATATKVPIIPITVPSQIMASTTYVQGAYNTLGTAINAIIDDSTVPTLEGGQQYKAIRSNKTVAENLVELDAAIKSAEQASGNTYVAIDSAVAQSPVENGSLHYLNSTSAGTNVGVNLGILDEKVFNNTTAIGTFDEAGNKNYVSGANSIQANIQALDGRVKTNTDAIGAYNAASSHYVIQDTNVFTNLHMLDNKVTTNALNIGDNTAAIGTIGNLAAGTGAIPAGTNNLVTAVNAINSSLNTATQNAAIAAGKYVAAGDSVSTAVGKLDTAIETNANNIGNVANMGTTATTVAGAVAEMHGQTIQIVSTWGSEENPTAVHLFPQKP